MHESTFDMDVRGVTVPDLECWLCTFCGADPIYTDQIRRNEARIKAATQQEAS